MGQQCVYSSGKAQDFSIQDAKIPHPLPQMQISSNHSTIDLEIELFRNKNADLLKVATRYFNQEKQQEFLGYQKQGKKQGYGQLKTKDSQQYYGYFKDNLPHIKGILVFQYDHYYIGQFQNGQMHGQGKQVTLFYEFTGEYKDGAKKNGIMKTEQFQYQGNFQKGKFQGYGQLTYSDGEQYKGQFKEGMFSGKGEYYSSDGTLIYEGAFQQSLYHGNGTYKWSDGSSYSGSYKQGAKHGLGKYIKDGQTVIGIWQEGVLVSKMRNCFQSISTATE